MAAYKLVRWPKILLFGDSITQVKIYKKVLSLVDQQMCPLVGKLTHELTINAGIPQLSFSADGCWGALVADHFQRRADIVARGFSGYNTRQCRALLPHLAEDLKGVVGATVFLGANDANEEENHIQAVPLQEYVKNLTAIVQHFETAGIKPVVITPPTLDAEAWQKHCDSQGKDFTKEEELTASYAQACVATAQQLKVPYIDLHTAMHNQADWKSLLCDGLHLSEKGSKFLASLLVPKLEKVLGECLPPSLLLPTYDELNPTDPATSFAEWAAKH